MHALECSPGKLEAPQTSQLATVSRYLTQNRENWTIQLVQIHLGALSCIAYLHMLNCISKSYLGYQISEGRLA